jgi:hypothetical protein
MLEKSSLAINLDMNFSWNERPYKECCTRKKCESATSGRGVENERIIKN